MIYVFGDSHGRESMKNFKIPSCNYAQSSYTMYRIGRDKIIPLYCESFNNKDNIFIFMYGEIDVRVHITKQLALGRILNDIIEQLVNNFFEAIILNVKEYKQIIIASIVPPVRILEYEAINSKCTHEFAFLGTDEERSCYTQMMNILLRNKCVIHNFTFLDFYNDYARLDGTLKFELSDKVCHIEDNACILEKLYILLQ